MKNNSSALLIFNEKMILKALEKQKLRGFYMKSRKGKQKLGNFRFDDKNEAPKGLFSNSEILGIAACFTPLQNAVKIAQREGFAALLEAGSIFTNLYNLVTLKSQPRNWMGFYLNRSCKREELL